MKYSEFVKQAAMFGVDTTPMEARARVRNPGESDADYAARMSSLDYGKAQAQDRTDTSTVNALAALGTLAGTGVFASARPDNIGWKDHDRQSVGGALAGGSLGGAAGSHLARLSGAGRGVKLLAGLLGATGGGIGGAITGQNI